MSDAYTNSEGILKLEKVTPVINALFGSLELDESFPEGDQVYIGYFSDRTDISWDTLHENLQELIAQLGLTLPEHVEDNAKQHLLLLTEHFGLQEDQQLQELIKQIDYDEEADLHTLFALAKAFNDHHGLRSVELNTSFSCNRRGEFQFGGEGYFNGTYFEITGLTSSVIDFGNKMEHALEKGNIDNAVRFISLKVNDILDGIKDHQLRETIRLQLGENF